MTLQERLDLILEVESCDDVPYLVKALNWLRREHWKQTESATECSGIADMNLEHIDVHLLAILEGEDE